MVIYVIFWQNYFFFKTYQVNRLDFNALKCWQTCHYIELSEYKLYMGHIHTLVSTREWIAMLRQSKDFMNVTNKNKNVSPMLYKLIFPINILQMNLEIT